MEAILPTFHALALNPPLRSIIANHPAARIESARAFRLNRPSDPQGSIRLYGSAASAAAIEQLQVPFH